MGGKEQVVSVWVKTDVDYVDSPLWVRCGWMFSTQGNSIVRNTIHKSVNRLILGVL